jgi:hypothetical protein
MQGIYTYIPETNNVPKECHVSAILSLLFMVPISLVPSLTLIYFTLLLLLLLLINCNCVDTRWQQNSTHLHTNSTQNTEDGAQMTIKKKKKIALSVRTHGTTRLPLDGFSLNFIFEYISKICEENSGFIKI